MNDLGIVLVIGAISVFVLLLFYMVFWGLSHDNRVSRLGAWVLFGAGMSMGLVSLLFGRSGCC